MRPGHPSRVNIVGRQYPPTVIITPLGHPSIASIRDSGDPPIVSITTLGYPLMAYAIDLNYSSEEEI